jgi:hypothetical protein
MVTSTHKPTKFLMGLERREIGLGHKCTVTGRAESETFKKFPLGLSLLSSVCIRAQGLVGKNLKVLCIKSRYIGNSRGE